MTRKTKKETIEKAAPTEGQAAPAAPAAPAAKTVELVVELNADSLDNGDACQLLAERGFPLKVSVSNLMPRQVSFPAIGGLFLGHVAGKPENATAEATLQCAESLHRFATDVQVICELSGYTRGLAIKPL